MSLFKDANGLLASSPCH